MSTPTTLLREPNFRRYFVGQFFSLTGTWMQSMALSWWVYRLTQSASAVGLVVFFNHIPAFLISPFAGVLTDRVNRRKLFLTVQTAAMIQAALLGCLALMDNPPLALIYALSVLAGLESGFEITVRHSFVADLVGRSEIPTALALSSGVMNATRVIGPAIGGILLSRFSEATCFFFNAVSYLAILLSLTRIKMAVRPAPVGGHGDFGTALFEAVAYLRTKLQLMRILFACTVLATLTAGVIVLFPPYAKLMLGGGPDTFATMTSSLAVGAVISAIWLGYHPELTKNIRNPIRNSFLMIGFAVIALSQVRTPWMAMILAGIYGYFQMRCWPLLNNAIQQRVSDEMRGRLLSFFTMTFLGAQPVASLLFGSLSDVIGVKSTLLLIGTLSVIVGLALLLMRNKKEHENRRNQIEISQVL